MEHSTRELPVRLQTMFLDEYLMLLKITSMKLLDLEPQEVLTT